MNNKKKKIRLQDIAEKTGFSISTISHYVNRTRNIDENTKAIISAAISELGYKGPSHRPHSDSSLKTLGVVIADIRVDYFTEFLRELEDLAYEEGFHIIVMDSEENKEKEEFCLKTLISRGVAGILIAPVDTSTDYGTFANIPIVQFDRLTDKSNINFVGIDNMRVSYNYIKKLLTKGLSQISIISFANNYYCQRERVHGYSLAMLEAGFFCKENLLSISVDADNTPDEIRNFLDSHQEIESVFCTSTNICYEVLAYIKDREKKGKPCGIKQVGTFDNNKWLEYISYPVDSISQPITDIALNCIKMVKRMIETGSSDQSPKRLFLNCTLEKRTKYLSTDTDISI